MIITDRCGPKVCSFADSLTRSLLRADFLLSGLPFSTSRIRGSASNRLALRKALVAMFLDPEARGVENMAESKKSLACRWWLTTENGKWTAESKGGVSTQTFPRAQSHHETK